MPFATETSLRLLDDRAERDSRADPSQSHAGDPDNARGMRRLDARAMGRSEGVAATAAGRSVEDRRTGRGQGRQGRRRVTDSGWQRAFDDPIQLPDGRTLITLHDAA